MSQRQNSTLSRFLIVANMILIGIVIVLLVSERSDSSLVTSARAQGAPVVLPNDMSNAVERVNQSIVSIGAERTVVGHARLEEYYLPFYIPMEYEQRVPYIGSGIIVSDDGLVLTNYHVVEDTGEFFATLPDGREVDVTLVDVDTVLDVAVLRLDCKDVVPAAIGDSENLRPGQWVMAVGNPFGSAIRDPHPTVTVGVVSALRRSFKPEEGRHRVYQDMIQTDAAINPGNSGGALVDSAGRVVGINTFIFTRSGGSQGIGFAIPINRAMRVVEEIKKHGRVRQLRADFEVVDITPRLQRYLGLKEPKGVFVRAIDRGGPATKAGLEPGDVILEIDGEAVSGAEEFWILFAVHYVGDEATIKVLRDGKEQTLSYQLTEGRRTE